ncbi:TPA: type VI secretion system protein TssA [Photobacterium damselae]
MSSMTTYREQLVNPIEGDDAVGLRIIDDPLLDFIDSQMMKVGSLSHADVQWHEVESCVVNLLSNKTKDIKLLTVLLQCLQHQPTPERFTLSIAVLVDFMSAYWETCHPVAGKRGVLPRKKFFNQICVRTSSATEKLDGTLFDAELKTTLEALVDELEHQASHYQLPLDLVDDIAAKVRRQLSQTLNHAAHQTVSQQQMTTSDNHHNNGNSPSPSVSAAPVPKLDIDGSNDRAIRTSLLKVSDFLSDIGGDGIGLSIRLRRFAVWFSINSLPDANQYGETQLMPVSSDRVSEYEDQLARGGDLALWRKVEQSLTVSPYWLDGHYLSYRIAKQLGENEWANTIYEELNRFLTRLPQLATLSFKGKIPFISEPALQWIKDSNTLPNNHKVASVGSWHGKRSEALELAQEGGLSVALAMLNDGLSQSSEPRDAFYWRLLSADIMKSQHLEAMATEQYQTLYHQAKEMSVTDWEPSLLEQLEQHIAP